MIQNWGITVKSTASDNANNENPVIREEDTYLPYFAR